MLKRYVFIVLFITSTSFLAQESFKTLISQSGKINFDNVVEKSDQYFRKKHQGKSSAQLSEGEFRDGEFVKFMRWKSFWKDRLDNDGNLADLSVENHLPEAKDAVQGIYSNLNWKNISYDKDLGVQIGLGRTSALGFHPTNPNIFYVGTAIGGIWKTTDGGNSYVPLGDKLPFLAVSSIIVDQNNPNIIYIAISDRVSYGPSGIGVYKSTDAGESWSATSLKFQFAENTRIYWMEADPNNSEKIWVGTERGLYKTDNGFRSVNKIADGAITDVKYKPESSNTLYYVNRSDGSFYRSTDGGNNFNLIERWSGSGYMRIVTTALNPNKVYVSFKNTLYKSTNSGSSFGTTSNLGTPNVNDGIVMISPANENHLYVGFFDMFTSKNNGNSFRQISHWLGESNLQLIHVDERNAFINPLQKDRIYLCNDGGVYTVNVNTDKFTNLSNGLIITQYYDIATSQSDPTVISGGSQDNGNVFRESDGNWKYAAPTADGMTQAINPNNANIRYNSTQNGTIYRFINGRRTNISNNIPGSPKSEWVVAFELDPNDPNTIVAGYDDVWRSRDRGNTWTNISPNLSVGNVVEKIAIAPSNSERIYGIDNFNNIPFIFIKNINSTEWRTIKTPAFRNAMDIAVDPDDHNHVLISLGGYIADQKVFESMDGGINWQNISSPNLPNVPAAAIEFYKSTDGNADAIFLGTDNGIFVREKGTDEWQKAGDFPNTRITDIEIQRSESLIRVATHGRGILEAELQSALLDVDELSIEELSLNASPNPTTGIVSLALPKLKNLSYSYAISDINGKVVLRKKSTVKNRAAIDLSSFSDGIYFIQLDTSKKKYMYKVMKKTR